MVVGFYSGERGNVIARGNPSLRREPVSAVNKVQSGTEHVNSQPQIFVVCPQLFVTPARPALAFLWCPPIRFFARAADLDHHILAFGEIDDLRQISPRLGGEADSDFQGRWGVFAS